AGMMPSLVSVKPKTVPSSATTASATAHRPAPPPSAAPWTRAITGLGQRSIARYMSDIASASRTGTASVVRRGVRPGPSEPGRMGFRRFLTAALAAAFLTVPLAPTGAQAPPAPAARSVDVTRATLPNGMQVVVLRDTLAPVVSTWMNYLTGSDEEAITGIAHAQEHMLFRGSKTLTASQFADTTAITGGTFNADTQNEMTQYFFEMPSQYLDVALNLE